MTNLMHKDDLVLITGITGFMATHIAKQLLQQGYRVRGTYRSESKLPFIMKLLPGIELAKADLNGDAGWADALDGVQWLFHVASPQAVATESHRSETAVTGIDNIFKFALQSPTLKKIVLTSSEAAIAYGGQNKPVYSENDWTDADMPRLNDYLKSKTLEERRAWALINDHTTNPRDIPMATINPSFVIGPSLVPWARYSAQQIMQLVRLPISLPMQGYAVDVRDVAAMQIALMNNAEANGTRNLAMGMKMSMADLRRESIQAMSRTGLRALALPLPVPMLWPFRHMGVLNDFYPRLRGQITYRPLHPEFYTYRFTNLHQSVGDTVQQLKRDGLIK